MQFDIVVPTRGNISHLKTLLACIEKQSLRPQRIIFVVNQYHWSLLQLQWEVSKDVSDDLYDCIDWHIISADDLQEMCDAHLHYLTMSILLMMITNSDRISSRELLLNTCH